MSHDLATAGDGAADSAADVGAVDVVAAVAADVTPKVPMAMNIATTVRISLFT
jgi:hypothetical protein